MPTPKQAALALIAALPNDATAEEICYEVYFHTKISIGLAQLERGETIDHETVMRDVDAMRFRAKVQRGLAQARRGETLTIEDSRQRLAKWLGQP